MLSAINVVEFAEGVAGPNAGLHLSELGANVIKLEPADGDWLRNAAPALEGSTLSAAFFALNRGKRSVALGSHPQAARPLVEALLQRADILITDRTAEELSVLGIDGASDTPFPANPRLITASISPWGRYGPLANKKGSELTAQAMAGYTRYLGSYGEPPRRLGADVASASTGIFALQAILAALYARRRNNRGQRVDLSLVNSLLALKSIHLAAQSDPDAYEGPRVGGANHPPERGWKTADEPIYIQFGGSVGPEGRKGWVDFIKEIGLERLLDDPRCDKAGRKSTGHGLYTHAMRSSYEEAFARYSAHEICEIIKKHRGNTAVYQSADETLAHPQTEALNIVRSAPGVNGVEVKVRAFPTRYSRLKPRIATIAPALGEHTRAVAAESGLSGEVIDRIIAEDGVV